MKIIYGLIALLGFWGVSMVEGDLEKSMERGKDVYENYCITCHMGNGEGIEGAFPPLAKSDFLMADAERAARIIKYGQSGEIVVNGVTYNSYMAELGLEDEEIADVMNFIMNSWGNKAEKMISVEFVEGIED